MTGYQTGGFALPGAFAGVLLAAGLFRLAGFIPRLGEFLDAAAPAAGLGIAVGRLGDRFSTADRSWFVPAREGFPFFLPVTDAAGTVSWRFPVFLWQAAAAFVLFLLFALLFIRARRPAGLRGACSGCSSPSIPPARPCWTAPATTGAGFPLMPLSASPSFYACCLS